MINAIALSSTAQKRSQYDQFGKDGLKAGGGFNFTFHSPADIFRDFFGTDNPFGDLFADFGEPFGKFLMGEACGQLSYLGHLLWLCL